PLKSPLDVGRITGDPLQPRHVETLSQVGGERDDPAIRLVGKPQEVAVGIDRLAVGVREVCLPYDPDAFTAMRADDVEDGFAVDDRQLELHSVCDGYSTLVAHVGSKTVSR